MTHFGSIDDFQGPTLHVMIYFERTLIESLVRQLVVIGRLYRWLNLDGAIFAAWCLVRVRLMSLVRTGGLIAVAVMMSVVANDISRWRILTLNNDNRREGWFLRSVSIIVDCL